MRELAEVLTEDGGAGEREPSALIWVHAICMIFCWGLCVPLGVFAGRYLRMSEGKILGFPKWLAYHKMLQILGSTFLAVGTFAIFTLKES